MVVGNPSFKLDQKWAETPTFNSIGQVLPVLPLAWPSVTVRQTRWFSNRLVFLKPDQLTSVFSITPTEKYT